MRYFDNSLKARLSHIFFSPLLEKAIEFLADPVLIIDKNKNIVWVNRQFEKLTAFMYDQVSGVSVNSLIFQRGSETLCRDVYCALSEAVQDKSTLDVNVRCADGSVFRADQVITVIRDMNGVISHWVCVLHDRTEADHVLQLERLRASQDPLTGLPGRTGIFESLQSGLQKTMPTRSLLAVIFIDLDDFKLVNDHFGHLTGDSLLQAVGLRLQGVVRSTDTVGRFGGDEFVVVLPLLGHRSVALDIANKLLEQLARPFSIQANVHRISASLGLAFCPDHGCGVDRLIERADAAMYEAKRLGGRRLVVAGEACGMAAACQEPTGSPAACISAPLRDSAIGSFLFD